MSVPNVVTCIVAMEPDRRHPLKAGAHRAPPLRGLRP